MTCLFTQLLHCCCPENNNARNSKIWNWVWGLPQMHGAAQERRPALHCCEATTQQPAGTGLEQCLT